MSGFEYGKNMKKNDKVIFIGAIHTPSISPYLPINPGL